MNAVNFFTYVKGVFRDFVSDTDWYEVANRKPLEVRGGDVSYVMKGFLKSMSIVLGLLAMVGWSYGQNYLPTSTSAGVQAASPNIQSPDASSFDLYGNYSALNFQGKPNITIPLYTFKRNRLTVPISLSYDAGGFRPDEHPGWIGAGWSLSCPYYITRKVRDQADDYQPYNNTPSGSFIGYYYHTGYFDCSNYWNTAGFISNVAYNAILLEPCQNGVPNPSYKQYLYTSYQQDHQPDEFSFHVLGLSGKFFLNDQGQWVVSCDHPVKVTLNGFLAGPNDPFWNESYPTFAGFTITDEDGTQYVFGGSQSSIEYYLNDYDQYNSAYGTTQKGTSFWNANSWALTKIVGALGDEIDFNYHQGGYVTQMYYGFSIHATAINYSGFISVPFNQSLDNQSITHSSLVKGVMIWPTYLSSITSKTGSVTFSTSNSTELAIAPSLLPMDYLGTGKYQFNTNVWQQLDNIAVRDDKGGLIETIKLNYSSSSSQRLTLLSVQEVGGSGNVKPPYQFSYNGTPTVGYLSTQTDHWGFWNGTTNRLFTWESTNYRPVNNVADAGFNWVSTYNGGTPPKHDSTPLVNYGLDRTPNPAYSQVGVLNKIVFPTGGYTAFTYEPNTYSYSVKPARSQGVDYMGSPGSPGIGGGVRISQIVSYSSSTSKPVVKKYFYWQNFSPTLNAAQANSSGVLNNKVQYLFYSSGTTVYNGSATGTGTFVVPYETRDFSSQDVLPGAYNTNLGLIGYSEVTEGRSDGGYKKVYYTNHDNGHQDEDPAAELTGLLGSSYSFSPYLPFTSKEQERGKVYKEQEFKGDGTLVRETDNTYAPSDGNFVRDVSAVKINIGNYGSIPIFSAQGASCKLYTYSYLPTKVISKNYYVSTATPVIGSVSYMYDPVYRLPQSVSTTLSQGATVTTYFARPYQIDAGYSGPGNVYTQMLSQNILPVISQYTVRQSSSNVTTMLSAKLDTYKGQGNGFVIDKNYSLEVLPGTLSSVVALPFLVNGSGGLAFDTRYSEAFNYALYDQNNNPTLTIGRLHDYTAYIWDGIGEHVIAEVKNALASVVAFTSFEPGSPGNWNFNAGGTEGLQQAKGGHYVYNFLLGKGSITSNQLPAATFKVSYWSYSPVSVNGTTPIFTSPADAHGWHYYLHKVTLSTPGSISVSGSNQMVDELRLHPSETLMTSYTYDNLVGQTSKEDEVGHHTYYEYDDFQRLRLVKDESGKILKRYNYNYQNQGPTFTWQGSGGTCETLPVPQYGTSGFNVTHDAGSYSATVSRGDASYPATIYFTFTVLCPQPVTTTHGCVSMAVGQTSVTVSNGTTCSGGSTSVSKNAKLSISSKNKIIPDYPSCLPGTPIVSFTLDNAVNNTPPSYSGRSAFSTRYQLSGGVATGVTESNSLTSGQGPYIFPSIDSSCGFRNTALTVPFTKQCTSGYQGSTVNFSIPANVVTSFVSAADANNLATQAYQAQGQAYANANGTCTIVCNGISFKAINGVCVAGVPTCVSSVCASGCGSPAVVSSSSNSPNKIIPNVPQCQPGYYYDSDVGYCVPNGSHPCKPGYYFDPKTNKCVPSPPVYTNTYCYTFPDGTKSATFTKTESSPCH